MSCAASKALEEKGLAHDGAASPAPSASGPVQPSGADATQTSHALGPPLVSSAVGSTEPVGESVSSMLTGSGLKHAVVMTSNPTAIEPRTS